MQTNHHTVRSQIAVRPKEDEIKKAIELANKKCNNIKGRIRPLQIYTR